MERHILEGGEILANVHPRLTCGKGPCPIHNRTDHSMRGFPQHFREDTGLMERICPHGAGHPDPDSLPYFESRGIKHMDIHGCDGCCAP